MPSKLDELARVASRGAATPPALEMLDEHIDEHIAAIQQRIFSKIDDGTLTQEEAFLSWAQVHAVHRLRRRLDRTREAGINASRRIAETLKATGGDHATEKAE